MANVKVVGNASGTGTVTIQTPDTNGTYDVNLPSAAGSLLTSTDVGSGLTLSGTTFSVDSDLRVDTISAQRGVGDTLTTSMTGAQTLNFLSYQNFVLTLTGNITLSNPTTEAVGQSGFIVFIQDGTGNRTVSLGTDYETAGGLGLTISSTAGATDVVPYIVIAANRILLGAPQLAFA